MKPFQPISLLLVLLFLFTHNMSAQKKQIGIDLGFGKTQMDTYSNHTYPYNGSYDGFEDYLKIGLGYQYTPKKLFSIKTGLYYEDRGNANHIRYLKVPVGIDFSIGSILFQLNIGAGLYSGFLISHTGSIFGYNEPKKINYGGYGNLGIAFQLLPKVNLDIRYQQDFDLTTFYVDHRTSPGGNKYT